MLLDGGRVAVIGGGIIGSSWAATFLRAGHPVTVYARRAETHVRLSHDIPVMAQCLDDGTEGSLGALALTADLQKAVASAAYVQEAIVEDHAEKTALFQELLRCVPDTAILASSTSGIPMSDIASELAGRERCLVAHPLTPPHLLPVVEIVPAPFTAPDVTEATITIMRRIGQTPVQLNKEQPGFVLNRLQIALLIELFHAIREGIVAAEEADALIRDGFGLRWAFVGPLEGIDLNAPGGIADYLTRYGALFEQLAKDRGHPGPVLTEDLIQELSGAQRAKRPLSDLPDRARWRDSKIAALRRLRNGH